MKHRKLIKQTFTATTALILWTLLNGANAQTPTDSANDVMPEPMPRVTVEELPTSNALARKVLDEGADWRAGKKGQIDDAKALELFAQASEMGDPVAKVAYACFADQTTTAAEAVNRAQEVLTDVQQQAKDGDGLASYFVGVFFAHGKATLPPDIKRDTVAYDYFDRGALAGNALAQFALAGMLLDGDGGTTDTARANTLLNESVEKGCLRANSNLGRLYIRDGRTTAGLTLLAKAAEAGDVTATNDLGLLHIRGTGDGVITPDPEQAGKWWQHAAYRFNSPIAAYNLSRLLRSGQITPDLPTANKLLQKAAQDNLPEAMIDWGHVLYYGDDGIVRDTTTAMHLWQQCAQAGNPRAMYNMAYALANDDRATSQTKAEATTWLKKAADLQQPEAMFDLGLLHLTGNQVEQITTLGLQLIKDAQEIAADTGNDNLKQKADDILNQWSAMETRANKLGTDPTLNADAFNAGKKVMYTVFGILALFILLTIALFFFTRKK